MALIYSANIVEVGDSEITPRTQATGYNDENVMDFWNLKQRFRADDVTKSNYLLLFDFGTTQALDAIFLNDVNFDTVKIQGHATNSWGSPSFDTGNTTISQNAVTGRYQVYIPLTSFSYRWMRIYIPSAASAVGSYTSKWEVGTVCPISLDTELTRNMSYGYQYWPEIQTTQNKKGDGGPDVVENSDWWRWKARLTFGDRVSDYEDELWTMNRISPATPMVFYENRGNTSRAYLCHKPDSMRGTITSSDGFKGGIMTLVELG